MVVLASRIGDQQDKIKLDFSSFTAVLGMLVTQIQAICVVVMIVLFMMMVVMVVLVFRMAALVPGRVCHLSMWRLMATTQANHNTFT